MNAEASVSLRLKVIEEGLSNLTTLLESLHKNSQEAETLRQEVASLSAEIARLKAANDAGSQSAEALRQRMADAEDKFGKTASAAEKLTESARKAGQGLGTAGDAGTKAGQDISQGMAGAEKAGTQAAKTLGEVGKAGTEAGKPLEQLDSTARKAGQGLDTAGDAGTKAGQEIAQGMAGAEKAGTQAANTLGEVGKAGTEAGKPLEQLDGTARKAGQGLATAGDAGTKAGQEIAQGMAGAGKAGTQAAKTLGEVEQAGTKAGKPLEQLDGAARKAGQGLGAAGDAGTKAGRDIAQGMAGAEKATGGVLSGLGNLKGQIASVAAAVAAYAGVRLFGSAVQSAAELEAKLSEVQAVSGATAQEMQALRKAAEDAGATTKFTAADGATALGTLTRAGLSAKDAIAALPATLQLAEAGGVELGQASEYVTKAVMGMGLTFGDAGRVADVLAKGANASSTSVTGLAEALSYAAPIARTVGLSLEQTVAIIGKFADAGIDASRAGTALNAILSQFSDPASKFRTELSTAGVTATDFGEALRQLASKGAVGERAILAVGTEAGPALRALLNQGIGALDELTGKLQNAKGSAAETAAIMGNNLQGSIGNLSSAWDTVKNALATPVLPVLKDGVNQLAEALNRAVSGGTVGRFGDAIAASFKAGIEWVRKFAGEVDFEALAARMQAFAGRAEAWFTSVGESARNAGNIVAVIFGVMTAGANAVLGVVFTIGEAFAGVASNIQSGVALLLEHWGRVTFFIPKLSEVFKAVAADVRVSAEATWAVSEAYEQKAQASFNKVAEGAELARDGWDGLTNAQQQTAAQAQATATAQQDVTRALSDTSKAAEAAADASVTSASTQQAAAAQTQAKVADLRREYEAAVSHGEWQRAAEIQQQIQLALGKTSGATKQGAADAREVEAAFEGLGIKSTAHLQRLADAAQRNYEIIRVSGVTSARDKQAAFEKYALAAVEANGGVVTAELNVQAAAAGMTVAVDEGGKAIVKSLTAVPAAASEAASGIDGLTDAQRRLNAELAREPKLRKDAKDAKDGKGGDDAPPKSAFEDDYRKRTGSGTVAGGNTLMSVINDLKGYGLDDAAAQQIAREFVDANGNVPYMNNPGQRKYGGPGGGTLSSALQTAASQYLYGKDGHGGEMARRAAAAAAPAPAPAASGQVAAPAPAPSAAPTTSRTVYAVAITINRGREETVEMASQDDAQALVAMLRRLESDAARVG
ncbi:MAG: hypothetical protein RLZZ494_177, partial [Pseudomonadota bacterium]